MQQDVLQTLEFLNQIDPYKQVERMIRMPIIRSRKPVIEGELWEDDAQHSWHLAMWAWMLMPYHSKPLDPLKVFKMCLCHDFGELNEQGDVSAFDKTGRIGKELREKATMERLLKLLPPTTAQELREIWTEYEDGQTEEARFVQGLDKLQPMVQNLISGGRDWYEDNITESMIRENKDHHYQDGTILHTLYNHVIAEGRRKGILEES